MYSKPQRALAEVLGTGALILVGPGSVVATLKLAGKIAPFTAADLLGISFAFGLVITAMVYAVGRISGCHINPAVTLALASTKRFPWREVPLYWAAQFVGATLGALVIWAVYGHTAIDLGVGQPSFNPDATSYAAASFTEAIGTLLLIVTILGIVDGKAPSQLAGLVIGLYVVGIIMVLGPITSCSINPARAFGPELVSAIGGGPTNWAQFLPVYLIGPFVGAVVGAFGYDFLNKPRVVTNAVASRTDVDVHELAAAGAGH
ncbi:MAG TPA: MIP/aquaporin family protein [Candidatus Dormibacteraeota bacterium]